MLHPPSKFVVVQNLDVILSQQELDLSISSIDIDTNMTTECAVPAWAWRHCTKLYKLQVCEKFCYIGTFRET